MWAAPRVNDATLPVTWETRSKWTGGGSAAGFGSAAAVGSMHRRAIQKLPVVHLLVHRQQPVQTPRALRAQCLGLRHDLRHDLCGKRIVHLVVVLACAVGETVILLAPPHRLY